MRITIEGQEKILEKFKRFDNVSDTFFNLVGEDLVANLEKHITPHSKTGKLERNIYYKADTEAVIAGIKDDAMIVNWNGRKVNYGVFLNYGTKDHDIAPKNKKALRWSPNGGGFAFSKGHRVRGIKAVDFIGKSARETFNNLDTIFNTALKKEQVI